MLLPLMHAYFLAADFQIENNVSLPKSFMVCCNNSCFNASIYKVTDFWRMTPDDPFRFESVPECIIRVNNQTIAKVILVRVEHIKAVPGALGGGRINHYVIRPAGGSQPKRPMPVEETTTGPCAIAFALPFFIFSHKFLS